MFEIYDSVKIKSKKINGTIVDIYNSSLDNSPVYVVESEKENESGGYGGKFKLFDCSESEIEKI